jgi:hypothetical protein
MLRTDDPIQPASTATEFRISGPPIIHETLDGEVIVINLESGTYYSLQGVGAEVWNALASPTSLDSIAGRLAAQHALDAQAAAGAVAALLGQLLDEGLIASIDGGRPASAPDHVAARLPETLREGLVLHRYSDVAELLMLDPVHDVDDVGWPVKAEP